MARDTSGTSLVTIVLLILAVFVVLPFFFMGFGMMGFGPMMGGMWGGGMWGGGTATGTMLLLGVVMPLLFLAVLVFVGYLVYRAVSGSDGPADRAQEELRLAYARGELTDEEYEHRREALERET
ncbi:SHOCT domain-containing protein [Halorarum salinum]|uniref:SHOCT domain-containing protein n=1 Tax=Halorarum salinum TaxID=2743089 RepID=A0A7D5QGB0_9EURY|nr:SHOCT domain-containing protein [Halobaculum salinum]QLG63921.1 SHOCT domain-containing protein [Halobaculum salinum]